MVARTTRELWGPTFALYFIENRGSCNVPTRYLVGRVAWRTVGQSEGYFADVPTRSYRYYPVEFNFEHMCWVRIQRNDPQDGWDTVEPAPREFHCNILETEVVPSYQVGPIDRVQETPISPETVASELSREPEEPQTYEPASAESSLAQQAELLHISEEPTIMATMTEEAPAKIQINIDPDMGHAQGEDETAALRRAAGSNRPDPPSEDHFPMRGIPVQRGNMGGFRPPGAYDIGPFRPPPGQGPPPDFRQYQPFQPPQGGMLQGPPGGRLPGGGGGGPPMPGGPPVGQLQGGNGGTDKLSGNPPTVFTGDRTKGEEFLTQ
jgi:hypothetical protein